MSPWESLQLSALAPGLGDFIIDNFIIEPRVASVAAFPACIPPHRHNFLTRRAEP